MASFDLPLFVRAGLSPTNDKRNNPPAVMGVKKNDRRPYRKYTKTISFPYIPVRCWADVGLMLDWCWTDVGLMVEANIKVLLDSDIAMAWGISSAKRSNMSVSPAWVHEHNDFLFRQIMRHISPSQPRGNTFRLNHCVGKLRQENNMLKLWLQQRRAYRIIELLASAGTWT